MAPREPLVDTTLPRMPSSFVERLDAVIERWASILPLHLRPELRDEFQAFGIEHDRTIGTIESIWQRRERRYAFDESTGLARRRPFHDHLAAVLATPESPVLRAVGVLFIDVNNLKKVNDTFGHAAGDKAVAVVGTIIREAIRVEQNTDFMTRTTAGEDDYSASRHGGDEFLIALELKDPSGIDIVAPRIKRHVDDPVRQRARGFTAPVDLTVSMGGVVYNLPAAPPPVPAGTLATSLITAADEQMYYAKRDGHIHIAAARYTDKLEVGHAHAI